MKFGMPALVECADIYECVKLCSECGIDFVEMNSSFPQYIPEKLDVDRLNELKEKTGVFYTMHADEQMNPFDFNPSVSECYFGEMRKLIRFALAVGMPIINLHLLKGVYVTLPEKVILLTDVYKDEYMSQVKRFIQMCEDEIGNSPLKISIENVDTNPFTSSQLEALELFMKSPVFSLTLDVGHEMCLGYKDSFVFKEYPEKLMHMHLHDCDGKKPHLALGDGIMNIDEKLAMLSDNATCVIEVKTIAGLRKSVEYLKTHNKIKQK